MIPALDDPAVSLPFLGDHDASRQDTTLAKVAYLAQPPLGFEPGRRGWVHRAMRLRVVEKRRDADLAAAIVKRRHYLGSWPTPPKTLILSYLADLGEPVAGSAAGLVMVALLPGQYHVMRALGIEQYETLSLVRTWRADDLAPTIAPDFTPEMLRRVIFGDPRSGLQAIEREWFWRKCSLEGLRAAPRLLVSYADPDQGHDGALYLGAGATYCGPAKCGKRLFGWGLDEKTREQLAAFGRAVADRSAA